MDDSNENLPKDIFPQSIREKVASQQPIKPGSPPPALQSNLNKEHHFLGPVVVFILCMALFYLSSLFSALPISRTFIIGAMAISAVITIVFSLAAFCIRKITKRFGRKWAIFSWLIILFAPVGVLGIMFWYQSRPSSAVRLFMEKDFYKTPSQDWKTYINEPFDLTLRYPPTLKFDETPSAYGLDDVYSVDLEPTDSVGGFGVSILSTTDQNKCSDLVANTTYKPLSTYTHKKNINGGEFLVGDVSLITGYGPLNMFVYIKKEPICKVAFVSFGITNNETQNILTETDYISAFQTTESILGSMDTDIKDTGSSDTIYAGEGPYALSMAVTRINGARGAAFRVYSYNPDNTPKSSKSYVGTCTDLAFKSTSPDMTCRESKTEFIMYFKMNNRYGYACGDKDWSGIVSTEPKGFYCR